MNSQNQDDLQTKVAGNVKKPVSGISYNPYSNLSRDDALRDAMAIISLSKRVMGNKDNHFDDEESYGFGVMMGCARSLLNYYHFGI